jgi:septum formation inhibitor MinC
MSKITIISRGDQALLVDITGCSTFKEAIEQLSSTFLSAGQFWQEQLIDLNLGSLLLTRPQAAQIIALTNGIGAKPNQVFARNAETINALEALQVVVTKGQPTPVSSITMMLKESSSATSLAAENPSTPQAQESSNIPQSGQQAKQDKSPNDQVPTNTKIEQVILFDDNGQTDKQEPSVASQTGTPDDAPDSVSATELETREDGYLVTTNPSVKGGKRSSLYLKQTLRAGQAISHKGDLIIIGDVNAGAEVLAEGDITIWGSLRGIAHAGIDGNTKAEIRALRLQPIQIRIANFIARSPDGPNISSLLVPGSPITAETAKLINGKIRIVRSTLEA